MSASSVKSAVIPLCNTTIPSVVGSYDPCVTQPPATVEEVKYPFNISSLNVFVLGLNLSSSNPLRYNS